MFWHSIWHSLWHSIWHLFGKGDMCPTVEESAQHDLELAFSLTVWGFSEAIGLGFQKALDFWLVKDKSQLVTMTMKTDTNSLKTQSMNGRGARASGLESLQWHFPDAHPVLVTATSKHASVLDPARPPNLKAQTSTSRPIYLVFMATSPTISASSVSARAHQRARLRPSPAASLSSHACRQTSWQPIDKHKPKETGTQRTNMNGGNKNPWRAMQNSSVRKKKSPNLNLCGQDFDQPLLASRGHSETLGSTGLKFSTGAISRPAFPLG